MEAPRGGGGSAARDDRLSVQDARDYFAHPDTRGRLYYTRRPKAAATSG